MVVPRYIWLSTVVDQVPNRIGEVLRQHQLNKPLRDLAKALKMKGKKD
jgi:hypothetical protein